MSLCHLRCLPTGPGAHSECSLSHPFPFTLLIEEARLAISQGNLTKQEVGNGTEEVCREIVFHFKMSAVEEERYIRAHRTFIGSLLLISYKSICWLLRGTKKDATSIDHQEKAQGTSCWNVGGGWSFLLSLRVIWNISSMLRLYLLSLCFFRLCLSICQVFLEIQ